MRKRPVVFVAIVGLMGVFLFLLSSPPVDHSLRERSRHNAALKGWIWEVGYQWHPDGYLIVEGHANRNTEVYRVDSESGKKQLLYRYTTKGTGYGFDDNGILSPDGRWRITTMLKQLIVASTDGARRIVIPNNTNRSPMQRNGPSYDRTVAWQPDGRHWVELAIEQGKNVLLIRAFDSPLATRVPVGAVSRGQSLLGVTHQNCAIVAVNWGRQVFTVPLNGKGGAPTSKFVAPPPGILPHQASLSPDGSQLVWTTSEVEPANPRDVVLGIYSHIRGRQPTTRDLWVSRIDGTGWRLLGKERFDQRKSHLLNQVRFTPDGKRVSYVFDNEFYTVPLP